MKSNPKDTSPKRSFEISKGLLKSKKLNQMDPVTVQSHCPSCGMLFARFKMQSKQALRQLLTNTLGLPEVNSHSYHKLVIIFFGLFCVRNRV